jgi:hypothetical protein
VQGAWTYLITESGLSGWVSAHQLAATNDRADPEVLDRLVATAPEGDRSAVRRSALVVSVTATKNGRADLAWLALGTNAGGTASFVRVQDATDTELASVRAEGTITSARVFEPAREGSTGSLLAIATRVATDPPGIERWSIRPLGSGPPMLELSLPTGADAPAAEKVRLATPHRPTARARDFSPLAVLGPARAVTRYTWDGTTLRPPAAPAP